jgi:hypothetical protein
VKPTHVTAQASWDEDKKRLVLDDSSLFNTRMSRLDPGAGERFVIRVEREADAKKYHRLKWYWGYVVKQCVEYTGHTVPEIDQMFRALFLPFDVPTISLLSDEQLREFNLQCEAYAAETIGVSITGPDDARHWRDSEEASVHA